MDHNILRYNNFVLLEHYKYIDSLILNESLSGDLSNFFRKVFNRIKNLSIDKKKNLLIYALTTALIFNSNDKILKVLNSDDLIKSELLSTPELKKVITDKLEESPFKDPISLELSSDGLDQIKAEEGDPKNPGEPVLKAYKLGDGRITVGWGHAEPVKKSNYKKGQKITREEARKLLDDDVARATEGVKRIFTQWKENGIERKVTQDQFDVLVSMAFNIGVQGLRTSKVIQHIKQGDYKSAAKSIEKEKLNTKFPGLENRREREADQFMSYIDDASNDIKL